MIRKPKPAVRRTKLLPSRLARHARTPVALPEAAQASGGLSHRPPWLRAVVAIVPIMGSLWVVAAAQGLRWQSDEDSASLKVFVGVESGPACCDEPGPHGPRIYPSVELSSVLYTAPSRAFRAVVHSTAAEYKQEIDAQPDIVDKGERQFGYARTTYIRIRFWKDRLFKKPAIVDAKDSLRLVIAANREIDEEVHGTIDSRVQFEPNPLVVTPDLLEFGYNVDCERVFTKSGQLEYVVPIVFKLPLDASKGFSQFSWRQELRASYGHLRTKLISSIEFDREFDEVRTLADEGLGADPSVQIGSFSLFNQASGEAIHDPKDVVRYLDTQLRWNSLPVGFIIRGRSSGRQDFVDFLIFAMAAVFGSAIASLYEVLSSPRRYA